MPLFKLPKRKLIPSLHKRLRKIKAPTIYGASDQHVTRAFIFNRAWIANERIVGLTALLVVGLGVIGYATFALSLNSPAGYIDSPVNNATLSGTNAAITGWAVAATPVDHVDIVVNGVPARASYGTGNPRPDVCAANLYPQSPNCPYVGWQYYFNSTAMPNGNYSLYAAIYGSGGGVTYTPTQSFTVQNFGPFGYIDTPGPGATVSGTVNVGGWALDNETAISKITMSIDGIATAYYPIYNANRPDVCAVYPGRPTCPNVGFNYSLDTTNIPNGTRALHVTIYDSDGIQRSATMDRTITVSNATSPNPTGPGTPPPPPGPPPLPIGNGIDPDGYMDDPKPAKTYSSTMTFDGWAIDAQTAISKVSVYIDGTYIGVQAHYGQSGLRPDICASHAGWFGCPTAQTAGNVGWYITYDSTKLANGTHKAFARIYDSDSTTHTHDTQTVTFTTQNSVTVPPPSGTGLPPAPPGTPLTNVPLASIDDPAVGAAAVKGTTTFDGWAIDSIVSPSTTISRVSFTIDNQTPGANQYVYTAQYGSGSARTDVCTKYQGQVNASVCSKGAFIGWQFNFDTTSLTNGTHTINLTAYDSDTPTPHTIALTRSFTVNNSTGQPGPNGGPGPTGSGENGPPTTFVDDPANNAVITSGRVRIDGWAVDNAYQPDKAIKNPQGIDILVDGIHKDYAVYGDLRDDVCDSPSYSGRQGCPYVGWHYDLKTLGYINGSHKITIKTTDTDSPTAHSSTYNFNIYIKNPTVPLPTLGLDPIANAGSIKGTVNIAGWALSPVAKISNVTLIINGRTYTANYGVPRPAACSVSSPDCPNVGFSYPFNSTEINNGTYQMTIIATAANNTSVSTNVNITINNPPITVSPRSTVDRPDDLSGNQVHVIYEVPSDFPDTGVGADNNGTLERSLNIGQTWLSAPPQMNGHKIKYDTYQGKIDITYFKSSYSTADFANAAAYGGSYGYINTGSMLRLSAINAGFKNTSKIYLIYGEAGAGQNGVCGVSDLRGSNTYDTAYYAIEFAYSPDSSKGACQSNALSSNPQLMGKKEASLMHETFHTMGLVPTCAPNTSKAGPYHVAGSNVGADMDNPEANGNDIMSPASGAPWVLDFNRNDYFIQGNTPALINLRDNCLPNLNHSPFIL